MSMHKKYEGLTVSAVIAALYVVLTVLSSAVNLAAGPIQFRLSEMLCLIPAETVYGIPGITCGCLLANLLTGAPPIDIILGTLATLIGGILTRLIGKRSAAIAALPPIFSNALLVPLVLRFGYGITSGYFILAASVGLGEAAVCLTLGRLLLLKVIRPLKASGRFPS